MNEELIYRRDCNLFAESMNYEGMIHDTMVEHGLIYNYDFDEDKIYEFAYAILQKAQNVIDTADTVAYEKAFKNFEGIIVNYLTYSENDNE